MPLGRRLEVREAAGGAPSAGDERLVNARVRGRTLLLVEDDAALREMLAWDLAELGYAVSAVGDCRAARTAAAGEDFALALVDIGLPDGDGAALASDLAVANPLLRIVLCSGQHIEPSPRGQTHPAIIARLPKPLSLGRLDALFRSAGEGE
jgi:DNA-binding NtrC family response regulator